MQLRARPVRVPQLHGLGAVLLLLAHVRGAAGGHLRHGHQPLPRRAREGGDGGVPRPGRRPGVGPHQGGQDHPQDDQEVPRRGSRPEHGAAQRGALPEHSLTSLVLRSLLKLNRYM